MGELVSLPTIIHIGDPRLPQWGQQVGACLNQATSASTPSTVAARDAFGRIKVADPVAANDAASKLYVDTLIGSAVAAFTPGTAYGTSVATPVTVVSRDAAGRTQFVDPAAAQDAATKNYTDTAIAGLKPVYGQAELVTAHGAKGDVATVTASITASSNQLTGGGFGSGDVGKLVFIPGAGSAGADFPAAISSVSGGTATLNATASTTVTSVTVTYGTDNTAAFTATQTAVGASGQVFIPEGAYMLGTPVSPGDYVTWVGAGKDQTVLYPVGTQHAFYRLGTATAPTPGNTSLGTKLKQLSFLNFTIDGMCQTGLQKGFYLNNCSDCAWVNVRVRNTGASGFGSDYLTDGCYFRDCEAVNAGRLGTTSSPGCSGFGVGTGNWPIEDVRFLNCTATGNKRFGMFLENQNTGQQSAGPQVIGGRYEGNGLAGISDNGSDGLTITGAHLVNNIGHGFEVTTTAAIHETGVNGQVSECVITGNGGDGVQLDYTQTGSATYGKYKITKNRILGNTGYGVRIRLDSTDPVVGVVVSHNTIRANGSCGVEIAGSSVSASILRKSMILHNEVLGNGTAAVSGHTYGIHVGATVDGTHFRGNTCTDEAASGSKKQTHGLYLTTGITLSGSGSIAANDLRDNSTATLANLGSATVTSPYVIRDNIDVPTAFASISTTGSPMTYTAGSRPEQHILSGGTVTQVSVNSVNLIGSGNYTGMFNLQPYDVVVITYGTAPTWKSRTI